MELFKHTLLTDEVLAQIRKLHFQTRRLAEQGIGGRYRSAFRGHGIEFEEVREYFPGDDVRSIDWKVTARTSHPHIKTYREERELTVMIAVDVSTSTLTGTRSQLRDALIAQVGAVLTLIAMNNNDKVGLVTFSDKLETYHPPRKARNAVWRILLEVMSRSESATAATSDTALKTNLEALCSFLSTVMKRSSIIFLISDFLDSGFEKSLGSLSRKHDVTAILVSDPADYELPSAGLIKTIEPESGKELIIDTSDKLFRKEYIERASKERKELRSVFMKYRVGFLELSTNKPFMHDLLRYFGRKSSRISRFEAHAWH